jgi:hypothetical protein
MASDGRASISCGCAFAALQVQRSVVEQFVHVVNRHLDDLHTHLAQDVSHQVVRHGARRLAIVQFHLDRHRFSRADINRDKNLVIFIAQQNQRIVLRIDADAFNGHFNHHDEATSLQALPMDFAFRLVWPCSLT